MKAFLTLLLTGLSCFGQGFSDASAPFLLSTSPLRRGLVGYWRLEEASGTRYDCSSSGNHLTSNNSVGMAPGKVNNCSTYTNGTHQYLSIPSNTSLNATTNYTLAGWINWAGSPAGDIASKWQAAPQLEWVIYLSANQFTLTVSSNGTGVTTLTASNFGALSTNIWYFICAWQDSSAGVLGVSVNNVTNLLAYTAGTFPGNTQFCLGKNTGSIITEWGGAIDEFGYWHRALTAAEQTQLYNAGLGTHFPWMHK